MDRLKNECLKLPWKDRLTLAQALLESLHKVEPSITGPAPKAQPQLGLMETVPDTSVRKISLDRAVADSFNRLREALESGLEAP